MTAIKTIQISGYNINLIINPISIISSKKLFTGQKLLHPYKIKNVEKLCNERQRRTINVSSYADEFVPDAVNDMINATTFEMKHDGACGYILWDPATQTFLPYTRYDVKKGSNGKFANIPADAIPCEPMPTNHEATHWPHFVPCNKNPKAYKWHIVAFNLMTQSGKLNGIETSFTCEYMGKKFNYKKCDGVEMDAVIVPHGLVTLEIPIELRTPIGFKQILEAFDFMEGIVVYGKDNVWKIRREMFCNENERLKWPSDSNEKISEKVMLV